MTAPPLIDRAALDDLFAQIGAEGARSVVELFVEESRGYLATIAEAAAAPDDVARRDRARRAAHSLKSAAGQIGAAALAAAAAAVERAAAENAPDLAHICAALRQSGRETTAALAEILAPPR